MITELKCRDIDLEKTFTCGQCFRWKHRPDGSFAGAAAKRAAHIKYASGVIVIEEDSVTDTPENRADAERFWTAYFDLSRDYGKAREWLLAHDEKIGDAVKAGDGIRILRQDLWETIVSFIISQNNNIPRIQGCIEALAELCGEKIPGSELYSLPSPEVLSGMTPDALAPVRLGYRAPYLALAAREYIKLRPLLEAGPSLQGTPGTANIAGTGKALTAAEEYSLLLSLTGVGPKVASCISLFGLGRIESFPIDVWVRRVMHEVYGFDEGDMRGMKKYAEEHFGQYGGLAQQYLFYFIRRQNM